MHSSSIDSRATTETYATFLTRSSDETVTPLPTPIFDYEQKSLESEASSSAEDDHPAPSLEERIEEAAKKAVTPGKSYPIIKSADDEWKVKGRLPKFGGIYQFKNLENGTVYIGKSDDIASRISNHMSSINNINSRSKLACAVRKGHDFAVSILFKTSDLPEGATLSQLESAIINNKKKQTTLYNVRNGGGGGISELQSTGRVRTRSEKEQTIQEILKKIRESYKTPEKKYPLSPSARVKLTPSKRKPAPDGTIYRFEYDNGRFKTYYIGETEQSLSKRLAPYSSQARNGSSKSFLPDMARSPEKSKFSVLPSLDGYDLKDVEIAYQRYYKEEGRSLYNKKEGGGSYPEKKKVSLDDMPVRNLNLDFN